MLAQLLLAASVLAAPTTDTTPSDTTRPRAAKPVVGSTSRSSASTPATLPALAQGSVDSIVVEKAARRLTLFVGDQAVRTYRIALGQNPVGPKRIMGDSRTPEGLYVIDRRNPNSKYFRSLHISYPNAVDRFLAAEKGHTAGGDVMIHGLAPEDAKKYGPEHWKVDWTQGCVAISNEEMVEMWDGVADGTRIRIKP